MAITSRNTIIPLDEKICVFNHVVNVAYGHIEQAPKHFAGRWQTYQTPITQPLFFTFVTVTETP
jgi:hypothetical protein